MPAIAVGRALVERGHDASTIHFVGSERGMETRMVPAAGFALTALSGRGIARRLTIDNIGAVAGLLRAFVQAIFLIRRLKPSVIVVVGGYASVPAAVAAFVWRVPLVVAEQNAVPGLANRLSSRFAKASAVSFPSTPLRRSVVTGNPVRPEIANADTSPAGRRAARDAQGLPGADLVIAVSGGSLGARRINEAVLELATRWSDRSGICIRHVVGRRDFAAMAARVPVAKPGGLVYTQVEFEDRMDLLLTAADVAVQRAGASTVSELTAIGLPSILVPLPGAPGDHQTANARRLADAGAAVLVADGDLDATRLEKELAPLLADASLRARMSAAARGLARPDAADAVARLAEEHARG